MAKIKLVVDTGADLPKDLEKKYKIDNIHFMTIFGETAYEADVDINNEEFYQKLSESDQIPTTSQTPYQTMYDTLLTLCKENDTVIYFVLSSKASGQYNTARMVREEILEEYPKADLRLVDSMSFSVYISSMAIYAAKLIEAGETDVDLILKKCEEYQASWRAYILVDTLKYLEKGGRITKTSAILGTVLDIKPVLTIRNGLVEPYEKLRGKKKIFQKLLALIRENPQFDAEHPAFMVVHSDRERGEEMAAALREEFGVEELELFSEFGPIVGTHIGPGALAVLCKLK